MSPRLPITPLAKFETLVDKNATLVVEMQTKDFIYLCSENDDHYNQIIEETKKGLDTYNPHHYDDIPYLRVDFRSARVLGHDGRHRCAMLLKEGGKYVTVVLVFQRLLENGTLVDGKWEDKHTTWANHPTGRPWETGDLPPTLYGQIYVERSIDTCRFISVRTAAEEYERLRRRLRSSDRRVA